MRVQMVVVKSVRKWAEVEGLAAAKMLTTRHDLQGGESTPDWSRFDQLKAFAQSYLADFKKQASCPRSASASASACASASYQPTHLRPSNCRTRWTFRRI